ncbi:N-acyl-D-amino-acid deacylase family protein [Flavilitoribacter nigricans]|uniref:N-acyl-D-amino acid deacylase n=1 Tax=Flavilitoribacter nigricans (strain ATCC 23147 / DSM 23189 / NBRC 102662 / NCIMB 1420 / SS-2) TaxID=1122177 RepID=A0A2D0NIF5_FLAN2|nr:amidohydrolase family protein [Flavilitoribacter nigricans]PHN08218.1 N-acyl-D-amino acid deacylase [Flavilitoribacter nigricans DSM 23189 = NBRC 102662]
MQHISLPSVFSTRFLIFVLLTNILFAACTSTDPFQEFLAAGGQEYDLLISGGQVLDGTDSVARRADILIQQDSIVFIGLIDTALVSVKQIIDAKGKYVTPGFIDTHAHGDPTETPAFENFLAQGVTTICLGQDGGSPGFEDLRPWMDQVDSIRTGVNIALFAGHGTLRRLSGVDYDREPGEDGLRRMEELLSAALDAGCFGMTTGLEYTPGTYAGDAELIALAKIVGQRNGLIMSHMRNEDNDAIEASLRELLRQGQYANVQASHLKVVYGKGAGRAEEVLAMLDSARRASTHTVTADVYPYTASYTGIGIVFPQWAKPPNIYGDVKQARREELLAFLRQKITDRNGPEATLFGTAPFAGKTLAEVAREQERPFEEVLLDIGPGGASGAYFVMNEDLQARLLQDPHVMICSDGSPTMRHPRGYGSFTKILTTYAQQEKLFSLPEAIRKMTSLPAETLGMAGRGHLRTGYFADLLIFDPERIEAKATFSEPHQWSEGMDWVIVNGEVAWQSGKLMGRNGRVVKK